MCNGSECIDTVTWIVVLMKPNPHAELHQGCSTIKKKLFLAARVVGSLQSNCNACDFCVYDCFDIKMK